jgi:two-component sensor histidine kinase
MVRPADSFGQRRRHAEPNENGSGLKLIASLARQIGGNIDEESDNKGTTTTLTFPLMR